MVTEGCIQFINSEPKKKKIEEYVENPLTESVYFKKEKL